MNDVDLDEDEEEYNDKLSILTPSDHYGLMVEFQWSEV